MNVRQLLAQNVRFYRGTLGISQMRLAELTDTSTGYICDIEHGRKFPSARMLDQLCYALSVKPYQLFMHDREIVVSNSVIKQIRNDVVLLEQTCRGLRAQIFNHYSW